MTFNIHRKMSDDDATLAAVGAEDADVVCLQEVTAAWVARLRARYAKQYPTMLFVPKENAGGLAILSHFPVEDHGIVPIPGGWHPGWIVHVLTPGGRVQVVMVHLRSLFNGDGDWISNYFATDSDHLWEMRAFMRRTTPDIPTIVAGDFNESPRGPAVQLLERHGFTNALPTFAPRQFTWYSRTMGLDMTIDHIMIGSRLAALDARAERRGRSDHLPVLAQVEMRN